MSFSPCIIDCLLCLSKIIEINECINEYISKIKAGFTLAAAAAYSMGSGACLFTVSGVNQPKFLAEFALENEPEDSQDPFCNSDHGYPGAV